MFKGLGHTAIASPDPERLTAWYVETLGFMINYRCASKVFVKAPDGGMLEIIFAEGEGLPQALKTPGLSHLAVKVDGFDAALQRLQEVGVERIGEPVDLQGNPPGFFTHAEGNDSHIIRHATPLD